MIFDTVLVLAESEGAEVGSRNAEVVPFCRWVGLLTFTMSGGGCHSHTWPVVRHCATGCRWGRLPFSCDSLAAGGSDHCYCAWCSASSGS